MTDTALPSRQSILGDFLRQKREELNPQQLGFAIGRRRTPGLRREEVAVRAGVSVTWYTWLEQGRSEGVSAEVLNSLADALCLSADERAYMLNLAHLVGQTGSESGDGVPSSARQILEHISAPAYVMDPYWTVVCWNQQAVEIFGDFGLLQQDDRNMLWSMFTNERSKQLTVDWTAQAEQMVARFRADYATYVDDPVFNAWVERLSAVSSVFAKLWTTHPIQARKDVAKGFNHPKLGRLTFMQSTMQLIEEPRLRMVIFVPISA